MFRALLVFSGITLAACGGGGVSASGLTDAELARSIAEELCAYTETCGTVAVECPEDSDGNVVCVANMSRVRPSTTSCLENTRLQFLAGFECLARDATVDGLIDACVNDTVEPGCPSEAELQAYADALNNGNFAAELRASPAACDSLNALYDCDEGAEN